MHNMVMVSFNTEGDGRGGLSEIGIAVQRFREHMDVQPGEAGRGFHEFIQIID